MRKLIWLAFVVGGVSAASAQDMFYKASGEGCVFQNQVVVKSVVNATYFCLMGNGYGYGGIQQQDSPQQHVGIFSIWDQSGEETTVVGYNKSGLDVKRAGRFGGEGTGVQFLFTYPWQAGVAYREAYRVALEPDGRHLRLSTFFFDPKVGHWVYAVTFRALSKGRLLGGPYIFTENYGSVWGEREALFSNAWWCDSASGTWTNLAAGSLINLPKGPNDFGRVDGTPAGFVVKSGPHVTKDQKDRDVVTYSPMGSERPIPVPYQISCGNATSTSAWEPDGYFVETQPTQVIEAGAAITTKRGSAPAEIYAQGRQGPDFSYRLVGLMPTSRYRVKLHFADYLFNESGKRREDIAVNGHPVTPGLDVARMAHGRNQAYDITLPVTSDEHGAVTIRFSANGEAPAIVCGIELS